MMVGMMPGLMWAAVVGMEYMNRGGAEKRGDCKRGQN